MQRCEACPLEIIRRRALEIHKQLQDDPLMAQEKRAKLKQQFYELGAVFKRVLELTAQS